MTIEAPVLVLNPHLAVVQTAKLQRPEVDVPDAVVDLLQADVFTDAHDRHVHPAAVPRNPAVGADVPDFKPIGILERRRAVRHGPRRQPVAGGRRLLVERLARAFVVELLAKDVERPLLRREAARRYGGGSWGGWHMSPAGYVAGTGTSRGATAAGGC